MMKVESAPGLANGVNSPCICIVLNFSLRFETLRS